MSGSIWKLPGMLLMLLLSWVGQAATLEEINACLDKADQLYAKGKWEEAFGLYKPALKDPNWDGNAGRIAGIRQAVDCLAKKGRLAEFDDFADAIVKAHSGKWWVLDAVASQYGRKDGFSQGFIVAGKFRRDGPCGWEEEEIPRDVYVHEQDRVRALQLMEQARPLLERSKASSIDKGDFFWRYAEWLCKDRQTLYSQDSMSAGFSAARQAWRLKLLTDLGKPPEYDARRRPGVSDSASLAPVDKDGHPLFYAVPKSFGQAASDGERWRWCLMQAMEYNPGLRGPVLRQWAPACDRLLQHLLCE